MAAATPPTRLEVLSETECTARLGRGHVGRLGFVTDRQVHVLPVNYAADATGEVLYRTSEGSLLSTVNGKGVVFEVDGFDARTRTGWSVCVRGVAREVLVPEGPTVTELVERAVVSWAPGPLDRWFAVEPTEITGRRLPMAGDNPGGWIEGVVS